MSHTSDAESWCSASHARHCAQVRASRVFKDFADIVALFAAGCPPNVAVQPRRLMIAPAADGCNRLLGSSSRRGSLRFGGQAPTLPKTLVIAVIVFQLRVVTGTPKSRSSVPR